MSRSPVRSSHRTTPQPASRTTQDGLKVGTGSPPSTPEEMAARRDFIEGLFLAGTPTAIVMREGTKRGYTPTQVLATLRDLRREYAEQYADEQPTSKTSQIARLRSDLTRMRSSTKVPYATITQTEKLVAEIEGNLAPRRLNIELGAVPDALAASVAGMTEASIEAAILEEREREKQLRAITVQGEASPTP